MYAINSQVLPEMVDKTCFGPAPPGLDQLGWICPPPGLSPPSKLSSALSLYSVSDVKFEHDTKHEVPTARSDSDGCKVSVYDNTSADSRGHSSDEDESEASSWHDNGEGPGASPELAVSGFNPDAPSFVPCLSPAQRTALRTSAPIFETQLLSCVPTTAQLFLSELLLLSSAGGCELDANCSHERRDRKKACRPSKRVRGKKACRPDKRVREKYAVLIDEAKKILEDDPGALETLLPPLLQSFEGDSDDFKKKVIDKLTAHAQIPRARPEEDEATLARHPCAPSGVESMAVGGDMVDALRSKAAIPQQTTKYFGPYQ